MRLKSRTIRASSVSPEHYCWLASVRRHCGICFNFNGRSGNGQWLQCISMYNVNGTGLHVSSIVSTQISKRMTSHAEFT